MKQEKLRHFHYSGNTLGRESVEQLSEIFDWQFPNNLKSLVLSKVKTNYVTLTKLTEYMCKMENLEKLVMQDLSLEDTLAPCHLGDPNFSQKECEDHKIGKNLLKFVDSNENIQNLQLINCKLNPSIMYKICQKLEMNQNLQNISFRNNVLRPERMDPFLMDF